MPEGRSFPFCFVAGFGDGTVPVADVAEVKAAVVAGANANREGGINAWFQQEGAER